jgi:hypothetical protein
VHRLRNQRVPTGTIPSDRVHRDDRPHVSALLGDRELRDGNLRDAEQRRVRHVRGRVLLAEQRVRGVHHELPERPIRKRRVRRDRRPQLHRVRDDWPLHDRDLLDGE